MSRFPRLLIGLAALASVAGCASGANVDEERAALMAADREWSQTTKEPETFVSYFADGASIYPPAMPIVTGGEAIRKTFAEMSTAPGFALSWTATKAEVGTSGDLGYTSGTYQMSMGGATEKGKYITVWKKQADGSWKVTEDIFNADAAPKPPAGTHATVPPSSLTWGDPPPGLPAGMRSAIVYGDPTQGQPYVIRAQLPANYRIPPHWHPTLENITVLSGTVALGMGDTLDEAAMQDVPAGGFATVPADMRHSFMAKTAATIQVHGMGPFAITYVNPSDDPRMKKSN
jgi:ketosteroid isomerase-like protein/quercetin dioxygenase-like cupin family protein